MMKQKWRVYLVLVLLMSVGVSQRPLHAANAVVGTGTPASCTEDAFNTALATVQGSGNGTITFNCGGAATIPFTGGKVISNAAVTIDGGGNITLNGGNTVRHFYVDTTATLTLQNITLRNGYDNTDGGGSILSLGIVALTNSTIRDSNVSSAYRGGAIMSLGLITISGSLIENNTGGSAGGLYLFGEDADATITGSTFHNNRTTHASYGYGGAISVWDGADVLMQDSTLTQNQAQYGGAIYNHDANSSIDIQQNSVLGQNSATITGGGIYASAGTFYLTNVSVNDNTSEGDAGGIRFVDVTATLSNVTINNNAASESGGGIYMNGTMNIFDSTMSNNAGRASGGGIYVWMGTLNVYRSTFSGNAASMGGGISLANGDVLNLTNVTLSQNTAFLGGGLSLNETQSTLNYVTFYGNTAVVEGGSIDLKSGTTTLKNVILQTNAGSRNCSLSGVSGIMSTEYNLASDSSCNLNGTGDQQNINAQLDPLQDNGGATSTHLPREGSPALDSGQCVVGISNDQRNVARPQGGMCDRGAVERTSNDRDIVFVYLPVVMK